MTSFEHKLPRRAKGCVHRGVFLLCLLITTANTPAEDFTWLTNSGGITITGYIGPSGTAAIPGTITGLPVVALGDGAFAGRANLTAITVPGSLTSIGPDAFGSCTRLITFTMPDSVTNCGPACFSGCSHLQSVTLSTQLNNLPDESFNGCSNLTSISIPASVGSIGARAFQYCGILSNARIGSGVTNLDLSAFDGCTLLDGIDVDALNNHYSGLDGVLLDKSQTTLLLFPEGKITDNYIVPSGVTTIGPKAFYNCTNLAGITFGGRIAKISNQAFAFCTGLTGLTIPDSVTTIEDGAQLPGGGALGAFSYCRGLTNVTIGNGVTNIGDYAFLVCGRLADVRLGTNVTTIGRLAFSYCANLSSIVIPDSVTDIKDGNSALGVSGAFNGCTSLTNVVIGNSVTNIGDNAFFECSSLPGIVLPDSVVRVGSDAFNGCASLANVTVGRNVSDLGNLFPGAALRAVNVDPANSTYSSRDGVLFDKAQTTLLLYPALKAGSYSVPEGVTSIVALAFAGCRSIPTVTLPDSVTYIGDAAFEYTLLTNITLGSHTAYIGNSAFYDCANLSHVTIPGTVTHIGDIAFAQCPKLAGVFFQGTAPSLGNLPFDSGNTVYYLPGTTGWDSTFGDVPTRLWNPVAQTRDTSFGVRQNLFGFNVAGTPDIPLVVEAGPDLITQAWISLQSCTLTNGLIHFSDPQWTNYPRRFYRIRSP